MTKKSHVLGGALILAAAGILSKVIGMFYRIPLQQIVGNDGFGLYQEVYPLYLTFLTLATAGVPVALSRMIAEALAEGNEESVRQILARSMAMMGAIGAGFTALLYAGATLLARLAGNPLLVQPIQALSLSLLFVPLTAVLRGFFYGRQQMLYVGVSQVAEQAMRVGLIVVAAVYLVSRGEDMVTVITGVNCGTALATLLSFALLALFYGWHERNTPRTPPSSGKQFDWRAHLQFARTVWNVAWPVCISALVIPLFSAVDSLLAINVFRYAWHVDGPTADSWFGIFSRGGPLLQLASLFGASISLSVVPAIAEANKRGEEERVRALSRLSCRFAWLIGLPAGLGLAAVSEGANLALYGDAEGTRAIAILGISAISLSMALATNGILQGLGRERIPAKHLLWGTAVKAAATVLFAALWNIDGLALSWLAATAFVWTLNMRAIMRLVRLPLLWRVDAVRPLMAAAAMVLLAGGAAEAASHALASIHPGPRLLGAAQAASGVAVGLTVYLVLALAVPLIERGEWEWLPGGTRLARVRDVLRKRDGSVQVKR